MPDRLANELDPSYYADFSEEARTLAFGERSGGFPIGSFLIGAGIGFAAACLFAPRSGSETRRQIVGSTRNLANATREQASRVLPQALQDRLRPADESGELAASVPGSSADIADLLNEASKDQLIAVKGIGPVLADRIIRHRPYSSERELLEKELLPRNVFEALRRELLNSD